MRLHEVSAARHPWRHNPALSTIVSTAAISDQSLAEEDHATTMIALIETRLGIDNVDAIAAVDGVDCLYLGHVDLSVDLGVPGRYDDPRLLDATHALAEACRKHGKIVHLGPGAPGGLEEMVRLGARIVMCGSDTGTLREAVAASVAEVRAKSQSKRKERSRRSFQDRTIRLLADDSREIRPVVVGRRGIAGAALSCCGHDTGEHRNQDTAFFRDLPLRFLIELATRFRDPRLSLLCPAGHHTRREKKWVSFHGAFLR